jgi:hypothetical protein
VSRDRPFSFRGGDSAYATSYNVKRATIDQRTVRHDRHRRHRQHLRRLRPRERRDRILRRLCDLSPAAKSADSDPTSATGDDHLTGTIIGSSGSYNNLGAGIQTVFDGTLRNYYDAAGGAAGSGRGLIFGDGDVHVITQLATRRGQLRRTRWSAAFSGLEHRRLLAGVVTLYTITSAPAYGQMTIRSLVNTRRRSASYSLTSAPANGLAQRRGSGVRRKTNASSAVRAGDA